MHLNPILQQEISTAVGSDVREARLIAKDEFTLTYDLDLVDSRQVRLRVPTSNNTVPIVETEVATLQYLAGRSTIPVPTVITHRGMGGELGTTCFAAIEKPSGISLEAVFPSITSSEQNQIIATLAKWMVELLQHRFDAIGSLRLEEPNVPRIGPVCMKPFYTDGRSKLALDRGPFGSAKAYYRACVQRELDSSRMLFVQDAPSSYQQELEESRLTVERIAGLLCDLISQCQGLDEDDLELAPFSLDLHDTLGLKNIYVSPENPTTILSVNEWHFVNTRPLWCCARLPSWIRSSMMGAKEEAARFAAVFKAEVARIAGPDSSVLRALDLGDTRSTLDDLSTYDAFRDGFLLLPALENILATLPGHEDVAGLTALLDPTTLPGRVARINLLTRGSNAMFLAMTPPRSPLLPSVQDEGMKNAIPTDSTLLVS